MIPQWLATHVRRWHANPHMCHTVDPIGGHQGRCAVLALVLWPDCSRDLLVACVTHDLGESVTGDIPFGAANKDNDAEMNALADLGMWFDLDQGDLARLKIVDRLDAYLWMLLTNPRLRKRKKWRKSCKWLEARGIEVPGRV